MIFHITTKNQWESATTTGWIEADSLATEGFIHMCYPNQLDGVLSRHFSGKYDLIKLTLNLDVIKDMIKVEFSAGLNDSFPHCFGKIPIAAVNAVENIKSSF